MNFKNLTLWVFLFGAIFLIAAFLFQQSKENRKQLQLQAMKSIVLTKQSFLDTFHNYHGQLDSYLRRYFYSKISEEDDPARKMVAIFDQENRFKISHVRLVKGAELRGNLIDSVHIQIFQSDSTWIVEENHLFDLDYGSANLTSADSLQKLIALLEDDPHFSFEGNWEDAGNSRAFRVTHAIDVYQLMKHNLNDEFFDAIYITDSLGNILYPSSAIGLDFFRQQFLKETNPPNDETQTKEEEEIPKVGNQHFRLSISSVDQEIFSTIIKLGEQKLYMFGAKNSEHFSRVALRINFNLLSAFLISLLLILACIPIFSIIKLDTGDILSKTKVYAVGLSLIMTGLILGFSISFIRHQSQAQGYPKKIYQIEQNFIAQIAPFSVLLGEKVPGKSYITHLTNELIDFDSKGMILSMKLNHLKDSLDFNQPFVSIARRDYVQRVFKDSSLKSKLFISAHYSQSTGRLEGVISKKVTDTTGKALTFKLDSLLDSLRKDERFFIFKPDGKIIFLSDKIKISVNRLEEAIGEDKWAEIKTLLDNNRHYPKDSITWKIPLYVNGYEYLGILKKIKVDRFDQPLWIIFLIDKNLQHVRTSLSAFEASVFFMGYFSLLILLSFLNSLATKQSIYLNIQSFSYSWFGPSSGKRNRFIILNYILFFDIIGFILIYNFMKMDIFAVFLFSTLFAIHAALAQFILIFPKHHQKMSNTGFRFIIPAFLLYCTNCSILGYYLYISPRPITGVIIVVFILQLMLLGWVFIREFSRARTKVINFNLFPFQETFYKKFSDFWYRISQVNDDKRIFAICFTLWAVLIGFVPGYVIHRAITHHEEYLWYHSQDVQKHSHQNLHPVFLGLTNHYEGIRRTAFSGLTDQEDNMVKNFLAPEQAIIESSFSRESVYPINDRGNGWTSTLGGSDLRLYILNTIQITGIVILILSLFILVVYLTQKIYLTEYLFTLSRPRLPGASKNSLKNFIVSIDNEVGVDWILYQRNLKPDEVYRYDFIEHPQHEDFIMIDLEKTLILENIHCVRNIFELSVFLRDLFTQYLPNQHPIFITSGSTLKRLLSTPLDPYESLIVSEVFSGFISYTVPLTFHRKAYPIPYASSPMDKMEMEEKKTFIKVLASKLFKDPKVTILENEINYGPNSMQIAAIITEELSQYPLDSKISQERFEKSLLAIQRHNKGFYINIWNELDQKERKMVYYFAKEGFINFMNRDILTELIQKGIFVLNAKEDGLVLFSRSFRNFVTMMITEKEKKSFKEDERKHGNVANIRTAAFSFIFLSIAIISYYDPSVLNKTSAYVSGIIGLIGTITSFLSKGMGSFSRAKKEEDN